MFNDRSHEPVGFSSAETSEKAETSSLIQTEPVTQESKATQIVNHQHAETQTFVEKKPIPEVDYARLALFLKRVTPGILEALDETANSNVLDEYNPMASRDSALPIRLLTKFSTLDEFTFKKKISAVTWSTNGGTLAIAYSSLSHETWCEHFSEIQLYELTRNDELQQTPGKKLEANSCVTCLSYHPTEPSIMAAGLFNGDVVVWNLADETSITPTAVCTHGDVVTSLIWRARTVNEPNLLITSSADGYIFVHKLTTNFTESSMHSRYKIIKEYNPAENTRPRSSGGRRERAAEAGLVITCFDFSSKNPSIFITGTLCGGIYKCSLDSVSAVQGDDTLIDPVIAEYERYEGSVTSLKCSPLSNIFVSTGTNKEIRIFDLEQNSSLRLITVEHTIVGLRWFTSSREIIATYGADSVVRFYDVINGTIVPHLEIESSGKNTTCLDFNTRRDTAALADTQGNLEIWKIPKQLSA